MRPYKTISKNEKQEFRNDSRKCRIYYNYIIYCVVPAAPTLMPHTTYLYCHWPILNAAFKFLFDFHVIKKKYLFNPHLLFLTGTRLQTSSFMVFNF